MFVHNGNRPIISYEEVQRLSSIGPCQ